MIAPFLAILAVMLAVMGSAWIVQRATANGGWVDVFWSLGTGASCCAAVLLWAADGAEWRRILVALLVALWSLRLGLYIAGRVARGPEDVRYVAFRREWGTSFQWRMARLTLIQAPVSALLGVAILYAARQPEPDFRLADGLGLAILFAAIAGEAVADRQMKRFKADPAHRGQVCDRGLWAWSRHPNYVCEALLWLAFPVIGTNLADPWSLLSWIAPAVMGAALRFGTGVPPLEAAMLASRGEAYRRYQQRVPAFLPRWPR
jgi:steroid 5-alpha reductase family enzyme